MAEPILAGDAHILRGIAAEATDNGAALPQPDLDAPAIVVYTSGSTGEPKGYARSQRQLLKQSLRHIMPLRIGPSDRILTLFSMTNGTGLFAGMGHCSPARSCL